MTVEWSVLIRADGPSGSPAPDPDTIAAVLERLPGEDKWYQYPPASGRGHGFEVRFWLDGPDAATAAADAHDLFDSIKGRLSIHDWRTVRVHVASVSERWTETYSGVDRRLEAGGPSHDWSVLVRAEAEGTRPRIERDQLREIRALLPGPDCDVAGRAGMVEARLWVEAVDAVEAGRIAGNALLVALAPVRDGNWTIVRVWATSLDERAREHYLGVERRLNDARR